MCDYYYDNHLHHHHYIISVDMYKYRSKGVYKLNTVKQTNKHTNKKRKARYQCCR